MKPGGPVGAQPRKGEQDKNGSRGNELRENFDVISGDNDRQSFSETDAVKGDGNRLGQEQDDADGAAEFQPQSPGNQVIDPADFDLDVGRNG